MQIERCPLHAQASDDRARQQAAAAGVFIDMWQSGSVEVANWMVAKDIVMVKASKPCAVPHGLHAARQDLEPETGKPNDYPPCRWIQ